MQLPAKFAIALISFGGSALSSAIAFLVIGSVWAVRADPSGSGSGYAIVGFMLIAPVIGVIAAIITTVVIFIITRLLPANIRPDPEMPLSAMQIIVLALASMLMGLFLVVISILLLVWLGY